MTDKSGKKKAKKGGKPSAQPSVLGSLPATRPNRMGRVREDGAGAAATVTKPAAATRPAAAAPPRASGPPSGARLVTTAVQAAGELAQIGASAGARALRRAASRLPKP